MTAIIIICCPVSSRRLACPAAATAAAAALLTAHEDDFEELFEDLVLDKRKRSSPVSACGGVRSAPPSRYCYVITKYLNYLAYDNVIVTSFSNESSDESGSALVASGFTSSQFHKTFSLCTLGVFIRSRSPT